MGIDGEELVKKLAEDPGNFPEIAASFHFSMLGFLAAFLAISVAITQTKPFQAYRNGGNLTVYLWLVSLTDVPPLSVAGRPSRLLKFDPIAAAFS